MNTQSQTETTGGPLARLWRFVARPSARYALGLIFLVGAAGGVIFWGGFNWAMELTNSQEFCTSCHEMRDNVFVEYRGTIHDSNRTGVRATCPDCHVPHEWIYKIQRKIQASNELYHHLVGSIKTPEDFEANRLRLATNVWTVMKKTDSRECRNCHNFAAMDVAQQGERARNVHITAYQGGQTCIDCHKGVAHKLPAGAFEAEKELNRRLAEERKKP